MMASTPSIMSILCCFVVIISVVSCTPPSYGKFPSPSTYGKSPWSYGKPQYGFYPTSQTCNVTVRGGDVMTGNPTPCGVCLCTRYTADCAGNGKNLTSIPKLPTSVRFLNFSHNLAVNVTKDFFVNVPQVTALDLSDCRIQYIHPEAFGVVKRLKVLIIGNNIELTPLTLTPVFQLKSLQCVDVRHDNLNKLPEVMFQKDALPRLESLYLHGNLLRDGDMRKFQNLTGLRVLAWDMNKVDEFHTASLPELVVFDAFSNNLDEFPRTCDSDGKTSLFPKLKSLVLVKNKIYDMPSELCLPSLEYLDLEGNYFQTFYTGMFKYQLFPSLQYLHLEFIGTAIEFIDSHAFQNPSLKMISLMHNDLDFSQERYFSDDSFAGCPNLTALQLSHNFFTEVTEQRFQRLFGNLTTLEAFYLGGCGIQNFSSTTFAKFPRLQEVQLYQNKLSSIPDGAFDNNPMLYRLQINENRISSITQRTFSEQVQKQFTWLDLSGNPFTCDCDLRWFSQWLRANNTPLSHEYYTYNCSNMNGVAVELFRIPDQACMLDPDVIQGIIAGASIFIVSFVSFALLFRFQWAFKLKLYEAFRGPSNVRRQLIQTGSFQFDVFVCYSARDKDWVVNHLQPQLEGRLHLKLCIHERDFILGKHIVDNIVECVEHSKKIILVFSKDFLLSSWCQFELAVCLQHVLDCSDSLMAVCVDDVMSRDLTSAMKAVVSTMTYIQWPRSSRGRDLFWGRVDQALEDVIASKTTTRERRAEKSLAVTSK